MAANYRDKAHRNDALIENVIFLLDPEKPRLPVEDVARRVGYKRTDSLTQQLRRAGRDDLIRRLYRDDVA